MATLSARHLGGGHVQRLGELLAVLLPLVSMACSHGTSPAAPAVGGMGGAVAVSGVTGLGGGSGSGVVSPGAAGAAGSSNRPSDAGRAGAAGRAGGSAPSGGTGGAGGSAGASTMGAAGMGGTTGTADGCTRDSLKAVIDSYFVAMAAHDPSPLPVASSLKFTENGQTLALGKGLWLTAGKLEFHRNLLDTERCGSLTQAVLDENGSPVIFGLRLKLDMQKITEVETYVSRSTEFSFMPQGIVNGASQDWEGILPADQRSTREVLNAAADAYFDLFSNTATVVPFDKPCNRWENGTQTTNGDCSTGIPGGLNMTHRRYPVADLESGIAVGFVLFGGSLLDFHMFKLKSGKVQLIQAVVGPRATASGWPDEPGRK
jgi:hypothetical protein